MWQRWKDKACALREQLVALYIAYGDPRTPWFAKLWAALVVAYAFSPIDLIPDFIPILGYLDDLMLVPFGIAVAIRMIPDEVLTDAHEQAAAGIDPPRAWGATITIVILWMMVLVWLGRMFWRLWRDWPEN